jgi:hypothetical protein
VRVNELQRYLDGLGLPRRASRAELVARFGLHRCRWSLDEVVELAIAAEPFAGLIRPVQFRHEPFRAQHVPPATLSAYADPEGDAMSNLRVVADRVAAALGPGEYEDQSVNARGWEWRVGPSRLRLIAFPPRLQDRRWTNDWTTREPRLREACHIFIDTGYRPPLSETERGWVDGFAASFTLGATVPPPPIPPRTPPSPGWLDRLLFGARARPPPRPPLAWANPAQTWVGNGFVGESALEYVREPPPSVERVFGRVGLSPGGEAVIWCADQLRIVPRAHVCGLRHDRFEPERGIGPGDSALVLLCRTDGSGRPVEATLARSAGIDSLDDLAPRVAVWLGVPLETLSQ